MKEREQRRRGERKMWRENLRGMRSEEGVKDTEAKTMKKGKEEKTEKEVGRGGKGRGKESEQYVSRRTQ